jgi:hypothetical protein
MKAVLYILFSAILTFGVSYSLGVLALRRLRITLYREQERFFGFVAGAALLSAIVFTLTALGLAHKGAFAAVAVLAIAAGVRARADRPAGASLPPVPLWWMRGFWVVFAFFTWLYLSKALAPESSADGVSYHVALAARYLREHRFPGITTNMYANLSEGMEMLFMFAFAFGKHSATAMCEFLFLLALPYGVITFGRTVGHPRAAVAAALLVYATPVVGHAGSIAYNDAAGMTVVFAIFFAVWLWRERRETGGLLLIGALAGFGYAIKYTLGVGLIYALAMVIWVCWRRGQSFRKPAVLVALAAALWIAPWMIKNTITVANPVSPFANRLFPNPYIKASFEDIYVGYLRKYDNVKPREIPWELTVRGERLAGLLGPIFLLSPLALLALRRPLGRQLLLVSAVFLLPYFNNIGARFLMPALPFVCFAMALVAECWPPALAALIVCHAVLSWPPYTARYTGRYVWRIEHPSWAAALRKMPENEYLRQFVMDYDIGWVIEQNVPAKAPILSASMMNQSYQRREVLVPYQSTFGSMMYGTMMRSVVDTMRPEMVDTLKFPPRDVRALRLVLANALHEAWTVAEVRVFADGKELPRDPAWRLRASASPWYVQQAFDNSLMTVWDSDLNGAPGMYLNIDFGKPTRVDRVDLYVPHSQREAVVRAEGDGRAIEANFSQDIVPLPSRMRRAAMEELKANGISWLVFRDEEFMADDLLGRSKLWGVRQVAERNGFRLWHID